MRHRHIVDSSSRTAARAGACPDTVAHAAHRPLVAPALDHRAVLLAFVVYATWRAFENAYYYATPYLSPFYSPCLSTNCAPGTDDLGTFVGRLVAALPAAADPGRPLGFRMTCLLLPQGVLPVLLAITAACAVAEPHRKYTGETRAPLILQNSHRWFFYAGLVFNVILTYDAFLGFRNGRGEWGHMGLGTVILLANATLLWLYVPVCHSCRHAVGGRLTALLASTRSAIARGRTSVGSTPGTPCLPGSHCLVSRSPTSTFACSPPARLLIPTFFSPRPTPRGDTPA